ncbi:hypothetical protein HK101_011701 [Irineochytrium annulatum]|nr:hypothetical protein HK101_011701 [Irineochytrium annulatum]
MVAMRLLSRYYENARSAAGPPRWDIREMEDRALMQMMASGQSLTADPASTAEEQYQLQVLLLQFRKDQDLRRGGAAQHPLPTTIQPSAKNPFSLLLASLITANKFMDDARFSNKWWSRVSEMPLPTINAVESDFLHHLNFTLVVPQREYDHWVERMQRFARMIEEGERLNPNSELNTSPNVSPINPPLNPAWNPGSPAQQLRSPASPFINAGQQGAAGSQGGLRLSAVASPLNPTWISAAPPPHYAGSSAPSPMPMGMNGGGGMGIPSPMPMGGMSQQGLGGMPPPLIQQPPGGQQGYGLGGGGPMSLMELLERQEALSQMFDGGRADGGGGGADLGCVTLVPDTGGEGGGMMDTSG